MEELDKELFSSTLRHTNTSFHLKAQKQFDEDDPLGDLLSSSEENTPLKKAPKKPSANELSDLSRQHSKSKLVADLFGLNEEHQAPNSPPVASLTTTTKPASRLEDPGDWLGLKADPETHPTENSDHDKYWTSKRSTPSLSKAASREDDIFGPLGSRDSFRSTNQSKAPQYPDESELKVTVPALKKSREDIQEPKKTASILSSFMSDFDRPAAPTESLTKETDDSRKTSYTPTASRESRHNSRRRSDLSDPLGLFSPSMNEQSKVTHEKETVNSKKDVELHIQTSKISQSPTSDKVPDWLGKKAAVHTSTQLSHNANSTLDEKPITKNDAKGAVPSDIDILTGLSNFESQAEEAAAQQQKSLITALALKRQEDALLRLQAQQAALLAQQEQQLGAMVQRQVQRQQQMNWQQEQLQAHIQALMIQPPTIPPVALPSALWNMEESVYVNPESQVVIQPSINRREKDLEFVSELKTQIQRLELENQDIKVKLESEKKRHENNLADMENIFRRQFNVQEEAMMKQEKRHLSEIDAMDKETVSRISRLKDDHTAMSNQQTQRMAQLHGEWLADLQRLGEFHQQAVEMLRSEQTSAIEHWKNLQSSEVAAEKQANHNAKLLETAAINLQESTTSLLELKDQMRREAQSNQSERQDALHKQELKLTVLQESLAEQIAALETERQGLSAMSRDLESHLQRQQHEFKDEKNRFEARERAWEKEKLGAIELLDQEKKHLERLQLQAQSELNELGERKLALAADVARLETTLHIQNDNANRSSHQAEQMVSEARSTLEAAQEAGKEVQRERDEIMSLQLTISAEKKRLDTFQKELQVREQLIEEEIVKAKSYREEGLSALEEARRLERERSEHASDLAQRLLYLKEREDRLAEEKLSVTMEWKRIQESRDSAICHHCAATVNMTSFSNSQNIVDPLPIIMKLEAEQGLDYISLEHPKYHSTLLESISQ